MKDQVRQPAIVSFSSRPQRCRRKARFGWLNSAQHFRKVDQYVTWKLRRWLQAKHQRRRRAFWRTPLAYWRKAGLYSTQGRIVYTS